MNKKFRPIKPGLKKDRFGLKLEKSCDHHWKPMGFPISNKGTRRKMQRCDLCGVTQIVRETEVTK